MNPSSDTLVHSIDLSDCFFDNGEVLSYYSWANPDFQNDYNFTLETCTSSWYDSDFDYVLISSNLFENLSDFLVFHYSPSNSDFGSDSTIYVGDTAIVSYPNINNVTFEFSGFSNLGSYGGSFTPSWDSSYYDLTSSPSPHVTLDFYQIPEPEECQECQECQECPVIPDNPYDDKLDNITQAIYTCGAILLVIYFFYCIYRMLIKNSGGK